MCAFCVCVKLKVLKWRREEEKKKREGEEERQKIKNIQENCMILTFCLVALAKWSCLTTGLAEKPQWRAKMGTTTITRTHVVSSHEKSGQLCVSSRSRTSLEKATFNSLTLFFFERKILRSTLCIVQQKMFLPTNKTQTAPWKSLTLFKYPCVTASSTWFKVALQCVNYRVCKSWLSVHCFLGADRKEQFG